MGSAVFRGMPARRPLDRFSQKLAQLITSWTPAHMQELGSIGSKGACLRMREIVTLGRLFFLFFNFMRIATGRLVGSITAVIRSNDAACWRSHSLYGFDS